MNNAASNPAPYLAIGMVVAPFNFERRDLARATMLQYEDVRDGAIAFRFVLGSAVRPKHDNSETTQLETQLRQELSTHTDVVVVDALDGKSVDTQCACTEKTVGWMQYALRRWPHATYYAKTEDDTYINLRTLLLDLRRLHSERRPNVLYGLFDLCGMPAEARPGRDNASFAAGGLAPLTGNQRPIEGLEGCWIGRVEELASGAKTAQWPAARALAMRSQCGLDTLASSRDGRSGAEDHSDLGRPSLIAPFPTGQLLVAAHDLAHDLFGGCAYLHAFVNAGRAANRRGSCLKSDGRRSIGSWALLTCDCAIGHVLSQCAAERAYNVTIAHMTITKAHLYSWRAGMAGYVAPSRLSIVVHALKRSGASGPNLTDDGEWMHAHHVAARSFDAGFPPLLYSFDPRRVADTGDVLIPIDSAHHEWYRGACNMPRLSRMRIENLTHGVRGVRADGQSDKDYFGGVPRLWQGWGCHPTRGHTYPNWPPRKSFSSRRAVLSQFEGRGANDEPMVWEAATRDGSLAWDWAVGVVGGGGRHLGVVKGGGGKSGGGSGKGGGGKGGVGGWGSGGGKGGGSKMGGGKGGSVWLAMGVIVTRWLPTFRWRSGARLGVEWRYVTTASVHKDDPRFAVVDCPDVFFANATAFGKGGAPKIQMGFQFSCFCKTVSWFRDALTIVPTAKYIGKMEDDSVLHDARVVSELIHAHRLSRREGGSPPANAPTAPLTWYGHFAWAAFLSPTGSGHAKFCGDGDAMLLDTTPHACTRQAQHGTLAPFASGGLDIRSRALAERLSVCTALWAFVGGFDPSNASYGASCDGQQGYFVARCLATYEASTKDKLGTAAPAGEGRRGVDKSERMHVATLLHLPWPKYHPASRRFGFRLHTSLLHPHRACSARTAKERLPGGGWSCERQLELPTTWRWNVGHALHPFRFRLYGARRTSAALPPTMWWEPSNRSALRVYNRLHMRREDDRYCDMLPCGVAAPPAVVRTPAGMNASACSSMDECVAGDGGVYFYQGAQTGAYV